MNREKWEERNLDMVEEGLLIKYDAVQAHLNAMWLERLGGCPHYHGHPEGVGSCDADEMRSCIYDINGGSCEVFQEILEEWKKEGVAG